MSSSDTSSEAGKRLMQSETESNSAGSHTRSMQTSSGLLGGLDGRLRRIGDSRAVRLRKTAVFSMAAFLAGLLSIYLYIGVSQELFAIAGTLATAITVVASFVTMIGLWVKKDPRIATVYAHFVGTLIGVLYPVSVAFGSGVGIVDDDGKPKMYMFTIILVVPAMIAFMLREKRSILGYAVASAVTIFAVTLWNPTQNDLAGTYQNMIFVIVIHSCITFVLAFFTDVADGLQAEQHVAKGRMRSAVREAKAERRANEAKTRFVSVMSHEIRNPLQAILLQLEMLETTPLNDAQGDYVSGITRASNVLLSIVNDILDVTKIESGAIALECIEMSLRDVVEFTLHTNAPKAAKQGVELLCNIDPNVNTAVLGDPTRIRQVLHNLVANALKFTAAGEVEVTLALVDSDVTWETDPSMDGVDPSDVSEGLEGGQAPRKRMRWKLSVRDTGIGIDEAGKQKLFQEFSQVDETTTRMYGGTGLGLFICKELSEIMGGHVAVESEPGVGSTFSATFLVEASGVEEELPVHIVSSTVQWTAVLYTTNSALSRILRQYVSFFFSGVQQVAFVTLDRPKAAEQRIRELLKECSPAHRLVVLANHSDCTHSLTKILTENDHGSCVPLVLSDDPVASVRRELQSEGWRNVVHKPVSLRQLCSTLDRAISVVEERGTLRNAKKEFSNAERVHGDGTLTRGMRLPTSEEIAEVSAVSAAANPTTETILIVDDFELVRSLVQQVVMSIGYNTIVAANGKEAVDQLKANYQRIAMVLMDCEMPIMDGYEATEAIRQFEADSGVSASKEVFICAMTANAMREDVKKCFARRMSGFLAKPVKRSDLEEVLSQNAAFPAKRGAAGGAGLSTDTAPAKRMTNKEGDKAAAAAVSGGDLVATSKSSRRKKRSKAGVDVVA